MPTYDYRCADCGHEFEAHQSFSDDALTECPECGGSVKKRFSAVGISFKGSGFYKNDARGSSGSSGSTSSGSTSTSAGSSDSGSASTTTPASSSSPSASTGSSSGD